MFGPSTDRQSNIDDSTCRTRSGDLVSASPYRYKCKGADGPVFLNCYLAGSRLFHLVDKSSPQSWRMGLGGGGSSVAKSNL